MAARVLVPSLLALLASTPAYAGTKVEICHVTSSGTVLLSVSSNAVAAHERHGDPATQTWYRDADGDGFGDASAPTRACTRPAGTVANADDCDDTRADVAPSAVETCDGADNDCDGAVDGPEAADARAWYADADGDGFGDAGTEALDCSAPLGFVEDGSDCDDDQPAVNPGAAETCSPFDDDCDGVVNEPEATDASTWYADADGDGYGDLGAAESACDQPAGTVGDASDCDDGDGEVHPGAAETCDTIDQDCDGAVDEDAVDRALFAADGDGDGFGDASATALTCDAPAGWVLLAAADCDDAAPGVYPGAAETCDAEDDDCDGVIDEPDAADAPTWYADPDGDGWGDPADAATACAQPEGYVAATCPGGVQTWYADADGDGFGDDATAVVACVAPAGFVALAGDCDDAWAGANPDAPETCDGEDQDCDGSVDEDGAAGEVAWYLDADGDGFGAGVALLACEAPAEHVALAGDCDDGAGAVHPGAAEVCGGTDEDCDGAVDEGATDAGTWFADRDGDGAGDPASASVACEAPAGTLAVAGDCDDGDAAIGPHATEICNEVDDDCDGVADGLEECLVYLAFRSDTPVDWFTAATDCEARGMHLVTVTDADELASLAALDAGSAAYWMGAARPSYESLLQQVDGYVGEGWAWVTEEAWGYTAWADAEPAEGAECGAVEIGGAGWLGLACDAEVYGWICEDDGLGAVDADGDGATWAGGDCDDSTATIGPDLVEQCDGFDDDCDGEVDEGFAAVGAHWYQDLDGDGVGTFEMAAHTCDGAPAGMVGEYGDCDDLDPGVGPGAEEACNGADDDCDGAVDEGGPWYLDLDGDGYGDPATEAASCDPASPTVDNGDDCDDTDASLNPTTAWYPDADGDGFGDGGAPVSACDPPAGTVRDGSDCADGDAAVNPLATDACNAVDDDCDGAVDEDPTCSTYVAGWSATPVDWFTAAAACEAAGLHLVTVGDEGEMAILDTFDAGPTLFWVGGARPVWENELAQVDGYVAEDWTWTTAEPWSYTAWAPGEPSAGDDELCLAVEVGGAGWVDVPCDEPVHAWLCEDDGLAVTDQDGDGATWGTGDCDDRSAAFGPAATEMCDGFDDDCDGEVDEGFGTIGTHHYADADGDGVGVYELALHTCGPAPAGTSTSYGDCDDADPAVAPTAPEACNGVDDDCDGAVDEGCP